MRVTGGELRSRKLVAPRGASTRPTQDRVREALFSILGSRGVFDDGPAAVLDLYAGTGALAIEALSRGAERAVLVEKGRDAIAAIRENLRALGLEARATLLSTSCEKAVADPSRLGGPFALVLVDPPYADVAAASRLVAAVVASLTPDATVVVEHATGSTLPPIAGLILEDSRVYGDTTLALLARG